MCNGTDHEHTEHTHEHSHEHTHADGTVHTHEHCHSHSHEHADGHTHDHIHEDGAVHNHTHTHSHAAASSPEEALALLTYMLGHNKHHADELHDLAHCFDSVEGDLIHEAVDKLKESNDLLEQALSLINNAK